MISKGRQLKELIHAPGILISPGVYDGFSARLVQKAGFRTGSISGAAVSESRPRSTWASGSALGPRPRS